jgi:nucleolar protein 4
MPACQGAKLKKWRLIVRNLPFQAKESALRELASKAGFVWQLTVPRGTDGRSAWERSRT